MTSVSTINHKERRSFHSAFPFPFVFSRFPVPQLPFTIPHPTPQFETLPFVNGGRQLPPTKIPLPSPLKRSIDPSLINFESYNNKTTIKECFYIHCPRKNSLPFPFPSRPLALLQSRNNVFAVFCFVFWPWSICQFRIFSRNR